MPASQVVQRSTSRRQVTTTPQIVRAGQDPLWYKTAIIYELHVRAFCDSNADGIGDFAGLTEKLPYLEDLGITAIWLLPFYPSPLRDDGYDIADYTTVNPSYGTMRDVRRFIREAHARGIRVITELVINHTSDQHPWFRRAREAPAGSPERDFYVWSETPEKYKGTRIIFQDFETSNWSWDPVAKAYYWHRFYHHQPDLNFDNPAVHDAVLKALDFWFDAGVDGMRLDAVPYLYEREGTNCENLPETHAFLKKLRAHLDEKYDGRMLLAEANQWPEDAAEYFGGGDECHMNFHFPVMPRLFMAVQMEDRFPIIDILEQTPDIPDNCQWAIFLRNHDELTLEMVTDEERDYMYRVYAGDRQARINLGIRRRLAALLQNNRRRIELMNALLFSLPGTPVMYYGDEIGMGDNIYLGDRDGVRTPMQWSADRNAGFSRANPQKLYLPVIIDPEYRYEAINVEAQLNNPSSLLWWMKRLIALRKQHKVFGHGSIRLLDPTNPKVLAFLRQHEDVSILVVANLSRYVQAVELDLADFNGYTPIEMFGQPEFPPIGDLPYFLTLGPHGFYWFLLERNPVHDTQVHAEQPADGGWTRPALETGGDLTKWITSTRSNEALQGVLRNYLPRRRWFRSKSEKIRRVHLRDRIPVPTELPDSDLTAFVAMIEFEYVNADNELYAVPLALGSAAHTAFVFGSESPAVIASVNRSSSDDSRLLYDAMVDPLFCTALLDVVARRTKLKGRSGSIECEAPSRNNMKLNAADLEVHIPRAEQSNSSVIYGHEYILKLYRSIAAGVNPDVEISRRLTTKTAFDRTPEFAAALHYTPSGGEPMTIAMLQHFVANEGDGWQYSLSQIDQYYEHLLSTGSEMDLSLPAGELRSPLLAAASLNNEDPLPEQVNTLIGTYLDSVEQLGRRTAEMHAALADGPDDPAFTPEPFTQLYQRSLYQSLRNSARRSLQMLRRQRPTAPEHSAAALEQVVSRESELMSRLADVSRRQLTGMRTRCHGDYHLGQVLWTGRDFCIIDFEGEPARALSERRLKWTPLRDVAGMIRSFHYAVRRGAIDAADAAAGEHDPMAAYWRYWVTVAYLRSYLSRLRELNPAILPENDADIRLLLDAWLLEKALYEVRYELNNRPDWVTIPLRGVLDILEHPA